MALETLKKLFTDRVENINDARKAVEEIIARINQIIAHINSGSGTGPPGPAGPAGAPGAAGATGPSGASGAALSMLFSNPERGRDGFQGVPGTPGATGATGLTGASGPAIPGRDGKKGKDSFVPGPPGRDGNSLERGTFTVDFGTGLFNAPALAVSVPTIKSTSVVIISPQIFGNDSPRFDDEYWVENITVVAGSITASVVFVAFAICRQGRA